MRQTFRWFGPDDPVSVRDMAQAGAEGVVSSLHFLPPGEVWTPDVIAARQAEIARFEDGTPSGLAWDVVESLPVSEAIKTQTGDLRAHVDAWRISLRNLAAAGIEVVCYNFMPVLDWTRTDSEHRLPDGATCMRFDLVDFVAFDLHILQRPGAADDYGPALREAAAAAHAAMDDTSRQRLARTVAAGLPGTSKGWTLEALSAALETYRGIDADRLRGHLIDFLSEVAPLAQELGLRLCCHPDDPPFDLLGLPRVMSTEADYAAVMAAVDLPASGITLCSGSLGVRAEADLPGMMDRLGDRVHFLHLRNVRREGEGLPVSFHEAAHLEGGTDMVALAGAILREERRRRSAGRADWSIPMRPDHGHVILDDVRRETRPGYPAIGRLRGLAELRGVFTALDHPALGMPG